MENKNGLHGSISKNSSTVKGSVESNSASFNNLKQQVELNTANIAEHKTLIDKINEKIVALTARIDNITSEILPLIQEELAKLKIYFENKLLKKAGGMYYDASGEFDPQGKSYWYMSSSKDDAYGTIIAGPYDFGTGGGGGGGSISKVKVEAIDWPTVITKGNECKLTVNWSSTKDEVPTGKGTITVYVNGTLAFSRKNVEQGVVDNLDVTQYLTGATNTVEVRAVDRYGSLDKVVQDIDVIEVKLTSDFDSNRILSGAFNFICKPETQGVKTLIYILDDIEVAREVITTTDQVTKQFSNWTHGDHKLEVYFTCVIGGSTVESNHLSYDLIYEVEGNLTPIIACSFDKLEQEQYIAFNIPYRAYTPGYNTSHIKYFVNGTLINELDVKQDIQKWNYEPREIGNVILKIQCQDVYKEFVVNVKSSEVPVTPVTSDLALALNTIGRSNAEPLEEREKWEDKDRGISCILTGFNWASDGWLKDSEDNTILKVTGAARVEIPYEVFPKGSEIRYTGKTIELEFATSEVMDYSSTILSCWSGERGFYITPQLGVIKSQSSYLQTQYKEDDHVRLSFVIEKQGGKRLIMMYVNGIMSGAVQYPTNDDFSQNVPVNISIGSDKATIDIYNIRIYDNNLDNKQVVNNWIADTQSAALKKQRYARNNNYNTSGEIDIEHLPDGLPYIVWDIDSLPVKKGEKLPGDVQFVDEANDSKNFNSINATYNVQGTSSSVYPVKNIRIKYEKNSDWPDKPFSWTNKDGKTIEEFAITEGGIGANYFTYKVDFASSEGANNVELTRLYNDASKEYGIKTPPQVQDSRVRVGVDGFPIVGFHKDANNKIKFSTKANFNNDKANEAVYGFEDGDESWEITNNTADEAKFKVPVTEKTFGNAFEIRYPDKDGYSNMSKLMPMTIWVSSTYRENASGDELPGIKLLTEKPSDWDTWYNTYLEKVDGIYNNVTKICPEFELNKYYRKVIIDDEPKYILLVAEPFDWKTNFESYYEKVDGVYINVIGPIPEFELNKYYVGVRYSYKTIVKAEDGSFSTLDVVSGFGYDTADYRLIKFKAELKDHFNVNSTLFYYLYTHQFLMIDSRAKNAFPTYFASRIEGDGGDRWFWLPYDMDTAIGIDNKGKLTFDYNLEDTDKVDGADVFNGQDSVMWNNVRDAFGGELAEMYSKLRAQGVFSFDVVENRFETHQGKWSENIFNEDSIIKYIDTLGGDNYLEMLQGGKIEQRKWWLYNRFKYMDSKYTTGKDDFIQFRAYVESGVKKPDITITPYADIYATVSYANGAYGTKSKRAERGKPVVIENPFSTQEAETDQETYIYSASQLKSIGDISAFKPDTVKVANAVKLQELYVGSGAVGYTNPHLTELTLGNNTLLKTLVVSNCINLTNAISIKNCINIEDVRFDNTRITELELPDGGILKRLWLPDTITTLILKDQPLLTDFVFEHKTNLQKLWLENIDSSLIDARSILTEMPEGGRVRLMGFNMNASNVEEIIALYDKLDTMSGINAQGGNVDKAQVEGTIKVDRMPYATYIELTSRYDKIVLDVEEIICTVTFYNCGEVYGDPVLVKLGNYVDKPAVDPEKEPTASEYYIFSHWTPWPVGEDKMVITADTDVDAVYTSHDQYYKFNFSVVPEPIESVDVKYGDYLPKPDDPEIEGAVFLGWYKDLSYVNIYDFNKTIDKNYDLSPYEKELTLYAKWADEANPVVEIDKTAFKNFDEFKYKITDNIAIVGYKIIKSPEEPVDWIHIEPTKEFNGSFVIDSAGVWYVWAIDSAGKTGFDCITAYSITKNYDDNLIDLKVLYNDKALNSYALQNINCKVNTCIIDTHYKELLLNINGIEYTSPDDIISVDLILDTNLSITATCNPKTYLVKFDICDEQELPEQDQTIVYKHYAISPIPRYKDRKLARYWYKEPEYINKWEFETMPVLDNMTLYAKWEDYTEPTRVKITANEATTITLNYYQSVASGVEVNWNDGSSFTSQSIGNITINHNYSAGDHIIDLTCNKGTYKLGIGDMNNQVVRPANLITGVEFAWNMSTTADYALQDAVNITSINIPLYMTTLATGMFYNCKGLSNINLPYNLSTIANQAFYGCSGLTGEFTIPEYVETIGWGSFTNCSGITKFNIPEVESIGSSAFSNCTGITEFNIPDSIDTISSGLLSGCTGLTTLDIPEHINYIDDSAFYGCTNLNKLIYRNKELSLGHFVIDKCKKLITAGPIGGDYNIEFAWDEELPDRAFETGANGSGLKSVVIPNTIKKIGISAFAYCQMLQDVKMPDALEEIGDQAFFMCSNIYRIELPYVGPDYNFKRIGSLAFYRCTRLSTIVIPASVNYIGGRAFEYCTGLSRVDMYTTSTGYRIETPSVAWFLNCSITNILHIQKTITDPDIVYGAYWRNKSATEKLEFIPDL